MILPDNSICSDCKEVVVQPWPMVKLGECCTIVNGATPSRNIPEYWGGDVHWFTPKDLSGVIGKYVDEAPEKISDEGFRSCSTHLLPPKSLLLTSRAPIGHIAINLREACTNQGFKSLIPSDNVDVEYLYYAIKRIIPQLQDLGNGATFKELSMATIKEVKIPLPSLAEQQRIAAILDAADAHSQKTKALLEKYDQLAQSIFLEMFGDPVTNERGWETIEVREIAHIVRGSSPRPKGDPRYYGEGVPRLMVADLTRDGMYVQPKIDSLTHEGAKLSRPMKAGDLVMAVSGRPGVSAILLCDCCIHDGFIGFRDLKEQHRKEFLHFYFSYFVENINAKAVGAIFKNLTVEEVNIMRVPLVPTKVQDEFVKKIIHVEDLKLRAVNSFEKSEFLFQSLLQGAFSGKVSN